MADNRFLDTVFTGSTLPREELKINGRYKPGNAKKLFRSNYFLRKSFLKKWLLRKSFFALPGLYNLGQPFTSSSSLGSVDSVNIKCSSSFQWFFKFFEVCTPDFQCFFQQHLVLNPSHRITAEEAMQHVYFADLSPTVKNM